MRFAKAEDRGFIQEILEHPGVAPWAVRGFEHLGLPDAETVTRTCNVMLWPDGFFALHPHHETAYEIHTCFIPSGSFFRQMRRARMVFRWLFTHTMAMEILTRVHIENKVAKVLALKCGFSFTTRIGDIEFFRLAVEDWLFQDNEMPECGVHVAEQLQLESPSPAILAMLGFIRRLDGAGLSAKGLEIMSRYHFFYGLPHIRVQHWEPLSLSHNGNTMTMNNQEATCQSLS